MGRHRQAPCPGCGQVRAVWRETSAIRAHVKPGTGRECSGSDHVVPPIVPMSDFATERGGLASGV